MAQKKKRSLKKKGPQKPSPADDRPKRRRRVRVRLNSKLRSAITMYLSAHGGASADQIRKELKMGHATIIRALTRMQSTGDVTSNGNGRRHWYLTPAKAKPVVKTEKPSVSSEEGTSLSALAHQMKLLAHQMVGTADLLCKEIQEKNEMLTKLQALLKK